MKRISLHIVPAPHGAIAMPVHQTASAMSTPPPAPIRDPWANVRKRS